MARTCGFYLTIVLIVDIVINIIGWARSWFASSAVLEPGCGADPASGLDGADAPDAA